MREQRSLSLKKEGGERREKGGGRMLALASLQLRRIGSAHIQGWSYHSVLSSLEMPSQAQHNTIKLTTRINHYQDMYTSLLKFKTASLRRASLRQAVGWKKIFA